MTTLHRGGRGDSAPSVYIVLAPLYEAGHLYDIGAEIWLTPERAKDLRGIVKSPEDKMMRDYHVK